MTTEEILVETLDELSPEDFDQFKLLLHTEGLSFITSERLKEANTEDVVKLLLELNRKDCVEETRKVLLKMERTDLVQRLSRIDSRAKEQQQIPLSHRVELMVSVIELLLETLADLTDIQLRDFHYHLDEIHPFRSDLDWPLTVMEDLNLQDTVFTLVQSFGQRSVNVTMEVLQKMEMTDLRKRLSDSSSGRTKKHSVDEHQSALIQKVATMAAVKQLLVETLEHLPYWELNRFMVHLQSIVYQRNPSYVPRTDIGMNYTSLSSDILDMMMEELGLQSLEVTREILEKMNRTDLVQRFLKTSSELKEQQQIPLSHRVELMVSVIELLLETLADLTDIQLIDFHHHLSGIHSLRYDYMSKLMKHYTDLQDTVLTLVQRFGQRSVEVTMKVLQKMKMTDLMKRLSDSSSGPTKKPLDEHLSAQIHKVATLAAIRELLLETLKDLSEQELSKVQWLLQFTCFQKNLPQLSVTGDSAAVVDQMMRTCGQQSLEVIMEVLMDMNRTDLVQRLSETSSGPKVKHSVDEHWPALIQKVELMVSVIELLLETLADLTDIQLRRFHHHMSGIHPLRSDLDWPLTVMDDRFSFMFSLMQHHTDLQDTVFTLVQRCGHQSVEVTMEVLQKMEMTDLMKRLSDSSSGPTKKLSVDELQSALIQKVATMAAVKQLLVETLEHLPYWELNRFMVHLQSIVYQRNPSYVPRTDIGMNYTSLSSDILDMMMKELGLQSMEVTREILEKMNRTDLVQRFLKSRSEFKASSASAGAAGGNLTTGEQQQIPLSHRVELMVSVIELLLETLADLTDIQLRRFHHHLDEIHSLRYDYMSSLIQHYTDLQDTVFTLVQRFGQRSVEVTMKVLQKMKMTDLMKRLSDSSSGRTKKPLDEHLSVQIHKVATLAAIRELLLETLKDLSKQELSKVQWLLQYTCFQKNLPQIPPRESVTGDSAAVVDQMMTTCGQQSLEVIMEVLMDMNRTDLVQRLSETSSGPKVKHSVDEHWPALIQKVELMVSVIELLLETLADLTDIQLRDFHRHMSGIHPLRSDLDWPLTVMDDRFSFMFSLMQHHTDLQDTVFTLVQRFGHQSVEVTMEVLQKMEMTDLRKRLSDSSSGPTKKPLDEHLSAQIHKVATLAAIRELLLETLKDLSKQELSKVQWLLQYTCFQKNLPQIPPRESVTGDSAAVVDQMMTTCGQQSLEVIMEVLMDMNRTDLVQRLSETSSGPKVKHSVDERWPALIQKVELMVSVIELLLETLADLTDIQLRCFHHHMSGIHPLRSDTVWPLTVMKDLNSKVRDIGHYMSGIHRHMSGIYRPRYDLDWPLTLEGKDPQDTVFTLVQSVGHQSVEVTMKVLQKMKMTDLRKRLSDSSSGPTKKLSVDEHQSALIQKVATMAAVKQLLVETLEHLPYWELNRFMVHLQRIVTQRNPSYNPLTDSGMSFTSLSSDILDMMMKELGLQSLEVTREILEKMNRTDLVQRFLKTSSELKEPSSSLDPEGSVKQDSRNWTKVEPVVNRTDEAKAPTYSLQSEAGHFECAVSGLRWVCEEKASLKYHFCSWEGHMEWMEHMHYMPAGSLMDVTVMTGKLKEVYLPHWICIDDIPDILNQFAVLHVNDCGDEVEEVSEVTASHVKLKEPIFSPRAVLMRAGLPVKINCNVLIYQTNTAFLTLHVYLIPQDGGLKQTITQEELSEGGCKKIRKPKPEKSLKMKSFFLLTADVDGARITPPEGLKLRYDTDPNFFEVHIKNPNRDFQLNLTQKNELQSVWTCFVQEGDYQSPYPPQASSASAGAAGGNMTTEGKHFVDEHQLELIRRVSNIKPILDELLVKGVIQEEAYATITAMSTCEDKMRALYIGPLKAGVACKDVFYETLKTHEKYLITDLNKGQ
ncbi:uncharacterized protein LOC125015984 isoform X3 [Mugil cephalus]|uniref:uncharacterized protein LOC125015984 isoform X3 n=1 Tax=Mugil cephalus TaxID=48193 RepID=UPI001FB6EFF5|nr:uncharacterized protein LOC125015984 isoform X3 [Mugil cephalus]